jgi:hypothetical protein
VIAALALASPTLAGTAGGGGDTATDCYATFDGVDADTVQCADGCPCDKDGATNNQCSFEVSLCVNQTGVAGCTPGTVSKLKVKPKKIGPVPPADLATANCGTAKAIAVRLKKKGKRPGTKKIRVNAKGSGGQDKDLLTLTCTPNTGSCEAAPLVCPANASGSDAPNEVILKVKASGTDLDNGWKGPSMNFPTPQDTTLQICLDNCDGTSDTQCDATIITGAGTFNKTTFGPPLPLFTAGVPVCVINEFAATSFPGGKVDLVTGDIEGPLNLLSHVFLTSSDRVCPKCENAKCDSGPNAGKACTVDGTVTVIESTAANKTFQLSKDCPPPDNAPAGTLKINLPLTTKTSALAPLPGGSAQTPCVQQPGEQRGVTPAPDQCSGAACSNSCTGTACARMEPHPVTGTPICIDAKGGLSQFCCANDTTRPCHPTRTGAVIERVGKPGPFQPAFPDATYPKTSEVVSVATFCEAATGTGSVDGLTGLPGPGALMLPATACLTKPGVICP